MELPGHPDIHPERIDRTRLRQAFQEVRNGFSTDRVVADPALNRRFIARCRTIGLDHPPADLNRALLNCRKASFLAGLPRSQRTSFRNEDEYGFASEISARFLERRCDTTLDRIICDPELVREFDEHAAQLAPGYSPLQYRWAALNLRKRKELRPQEGAHLLPTTGGALELVSSLDLEALPTSPGLYVYYAADQRQALYAGETENLRRRTRKHLDHSDNRGLARWLWEHGEDGLWIEIHELPSVTSNRQRRALERELIRERNPLFNVRDR